MYTLFYLLGYLAILCFIVLALVRMFTFTSSSPLHIRWELYPIPHEGPERASYGGSYMEESDWWTKPRHVDHCMDIKAILREVLFLENTYENNSPLWLRTFPFHWGMYFLMGGTMILIFAVILELCGVSPDDGFLIFIGNVINVIVLVGAFCIAGGGCALLQRRFADPGLRRYTAFEQVANLVSFIIFGVLTLCAWTFNPSYYDVAMNFIYNLCTGNFEPLGSFWFVLNMLAGYCVLVFIPISNMRHLIMKYFMYHDIRWGDEATIYSKKNQRLIGVDLHLKENWDAPHISEDSSDEKTWLDVATSNPAKKQ